MNNGIAVNCSSFPRKLVKNTDVREVVTAATAGV